MKILTHVTVTSTLKMQFSETITRTISFISQLELLQGSKYSHTQVTMNNGNITFILTNTQKLIP